MRQTQQVGAQDNIKRGSQATSKEWISAGVIARAENAHLKHGMTALKKDNIQRQRYEYKYVINERIALAIRDFVSSYLDPDPYGSTQPMYSYPVHSLYLDSPSLRTFQETVNGDRNRFKLRIRYYENQRDKPVYFEIKRRADRVISKKRVVVYRNAAEDLARGYLPGFESLANPVAEQMDALIDFTRLVNHLQARPRVHVSYLREAWIADGHNKIRVTLDRNVQSEPERRVSFDYDFAHPNSVFGEQVILELKFTDRFPLWFKELVQVFGLRQGGAAKYVQGILNMGEHRVMQHQDYSQFGAQGTSTRAQSPSTLSQSQNTTQTERVSTATRAQSPSAPARAHSPTLTL